MLVILPTGGGKTLLYLLPSLIEKDMTTVVIFPFIALQLQNQQSGYGVLWNGNVAHIPLLFATVEESITPEFRAHLHMLNSTRRLSRIGCAISGGFDRRPN